MAKCDCFFQHGLKFLCYGTKEREECSCGGDTSKCDFYTEKRKQNAQKMAEKRLIDANALLAKFKEHRDLYAPSWESFKTSSIHVKSRVDEIDTCMADVINAPTLDAVEVVHGRWEDMYDGKYANPRYRCSACKEKALYKMEQDELLSWHEVQALTDYCPNCGAKMDGDVE